LLDIDIAAMPPDVLSALREREWLLFEISGYSTDGV